MRIKLIAPARKPEWGESFWDLRTLCRLTGRRAGGAPLALPTLAALTPPEYEVVLVDESVEPVNCDEKVDLVGITCMTCVIPRAYEIADCYRAKGIPVVMGGIHVSMLPEEALAHCDAVVIGEAEDVWAGLVNDAREGKLQKRYQAIGYPDLTRAPVPRWDLLRSQRYYYFTIQTGRGCPYDCEFCSVKVFNGRSYRHKAVQQVIDEVRRLQSIDPRKLLFFTDDNLLADPAYAEELLRALKALGLRNWWCQSSVNRLDDDTLLPLMYEAGCRVVFVGLESVSRDSVAAMRKEGVNKVEEYSRVLAKVHKHGIAVFASFVLGGDADTDSIFEETARFIEANQITFSMLNIMTPFPGTTLYASLERDGRLSHKDWSRYNAEHVCFEPLHLSSEQLASRATDLAQEVYAYERMYQRLAYAWAQGVFKRSGATARMLTKGRILFSLMNALLPDVRRRQFIQRSLWGNGPTAVSAVSLAINFHDFAFRSRCG